MSRRAVVLVCDGLGVGEAPDAEAYGDQGSNTLAHALDRHAAALPNLERLGLTGLVGKGRPGGARGKMSELSAGKDTTTGHWEMMGLVVERPFPLYPHGFPPEVIRPFEEHAGKAVLGNKAASGTVILEELGAEHLATGRPILYTSGDSVFQVACHEELWPPEKLWELCRFARGILTGVHNVGRVIARPFVGTPGILQAHGQPARLHGRANRRDVARPARRIGAPRLRRRQDRGHLLGPRHHGRGPHGLGRRGTPGHGGAPPRRAAGTSSSRTSWTSTASTGIATIRRDSSAALAILDEGLPEVLVALGADDLFLLTADHGCETTDASTDHTREYVPLLAAGPRIRPDIDLGVRRGFCDLAATAGEWLSVPAPRGGSALAQILAG